jgi:hypothetical protein
MAPVFTMGMCSSHGVKGTDMSSTGKCCNASSWFAGTSLEAQLLLCWVALTVAVCSDVDCLWLYTITSNSFILACMLSSRSHVSCISCSNLRSRTASSSFLRWRLLYVSASSGKPYCHEMIDPLPCVHPGCSGAWRAYVSSSFSRLGTKTPQAEASTVSKSLSAASLIVGLIRGAPISVSSAPHVWKTNSWSIRASPMKMDGPLWQPSLILFFPTLEWQSCIHLIRFYDGIPSFAHSLGSFSPVSHPLSEVLYLTNSGH